MATVAALSTDSYSCFTDLLASATATAAVLLVLGWVTELEEAAALAMGGSVFTMKVVTDITDRSVGIASETLPSNLLIYLRLTVVHCSSGQSSESGSNANWLRCCYACARIATILVPETPTITTINVANSVQTDGYLQCYTSSLSSTFV